MLQLERAVGGAAEHQTLEERAVELVVSRADGQLVRLHLGTQLRGGGHVEYGVGRAHTLYGINI